MINSENYVDHVLKSEAHITTAIISRISDPKVIRLLHGAIGLSTEAGELLDMLKKHIYYGKPLDLINAKEEVGDSMWYAGLVIDVLKTTFDEVLTVNIDKLKARYPEKFTEFHAVNRDLETERKILEG
jgi:NTP pyrophosphatase (non-canonical NTP hydrolase)